MPGILRSAAWRASRAGERATLMEMGLMNFHRIALMVAVLAVPCTANAFWFGGSCGSCGGCNSCASSCDSCGGFSGGCGSHGGCFGGCLGRLFSHGSCGSCGGWSCGCQSCGCVRSCGCGHESSCGCSSCGCGSEGSSCGCGGEVKEGNHAEPAMAAPAAPAKDEKKAAPA